MNKKFNIQYWFSRNKKEMNLATKIGAGYYDENGVYVHVIFLGNKLQTDIEYNRKSLRFRRRYKSIRVIKKS